MESEICLMNQHNPFHIAIPAFFSFQECIWFLNRNYDDCLHVIDHTGIRKALEINGELVVFQVRERASFLEVEILAGENIPASQEYLSHYIIDWFDMGRDMKPFYKLLADDASLSYMADAYRGLRLVGITDLFEALCWSIIGQQINLTFAYKLKRRLVEHFGKSIELENEVHHVFPSCEVLAGGSAEALRNMQFSQKKAEYLIGIARAFASGSLSKDMVSNLPDFEAKQKLLLTHKGIGVWTANYALMKSLRETSGIPHGDVGLLNALASHGIIGSRAELEKINTFFSAYTGWESYLVFYLWRSLSVK